MIAVILINNIPLKIIKINKLEITILTEAI